MNEELKEAIKDIGYKSANVQRGEWQDGDFKNIENTILELYRGVDDLNNEAEKAFLDNLLIVPSRSQFLKDNIDELELSIFDLIDEFEFCETMNDFVESVLDGYGFITKNNFVVTVKTL